MTAMLTSVLVLFALLVLGFVLGKRRIVRPEVAQDLSGFLIKAALPCTVFNSMLRPYEPELLTAGVQVLVVITVFHFVMMGLGLLLVRIGRIKPQEAGVWIFVCMFSNNGFIGLPLTQAVYGSDAMFLMAISNMITNLLIFSVGVKLLTKGTGVRLSLKSMLLTNINIAVALGLVFYFMQWSLPEPIQRILNYVAGTTNCLSMMVVGLSLAKQDLKKLITDGHTWYLTGIRLVLIPLLAFGLLLLLPLSSDAERIVFLTSMLPAAGSVTLVSEQYGLDSGLASRVVSLSALLCVVTIPLFMLFGI